MQDPGSEVRGQATATPLSIIFRAGHSGLRRGRRPSLGEETATTPFSAISSIPLSLANKRWSAETGADLRGQLGPA